MFKFLAKGKIFGGLYLGWGIGANDSANIFGPAVATNSVRYKTAVILIAIFVIIGSILEGAPLYDNVQFSADMTNSAAFISTISAAIAVTIVTFLAIPASTSQAAIGAMMGVAVALSGYKAVDWSKLLKMFICWVATPIGSAIVTVIMYKVGQYFINKYVKDVILLNKIYKWLLIISGSYGAYALGANNVVVTTATYYQAGMFASFGKWAAYYAAGLGGIAIAFGALTYSKKVMETVGKKITILDPFSAVVTVFAHSLALHFFTLLKVPVSSSQAIVGSVIGIGIMKGVKAMSYKTIGFIFLGWVLTPISGMITAFILVKIFL